MNATVIGAQLGDEGKGAMVDLLGDTADIVVRYQGGANAGHTVITDNEEYHLRLIPSGAVRGNVGIVGPGCVVDVAMLFEELDSLAERGLDPEVYVDPRAHVVMPYHHALDRGEEDAKRKSLTVDTTGNGIGPAYEDKAGRRGIRVGDLTTSAELDALLNDVLPRKQAIATKVLGIDAGEAFDPERLSEQYQEFGDRLQEEGRLLDTGEYLHDRVERGDTVLFESAQGTYLDVDHGNYPFVTSSNPTTGGAIVGTGVSPKLVSDGAVVGVVKAYLSRVGNGPMPTELDEPAAATFRDRVDGFGTNTGRPRRIGWLDLPMVRYAVRVNGFTGLALNHVDALAGLDEVKVCTAYELDGERLSTVPPSSAEWTDCSPIYESFEPWADRDWSEVAAAGFEALPANAGQYIEFVGSELNLPVYTIGVGPARTDTIIRQHPIRE